MNIKLSIEFQKRAGTYERNQAIKMLAKSGMPYSKIGLLYNRSKQRIGQIVKLPDEKHYKGQESPLNFIKGKYITVKRLFVKAFRFHHPPLRE